MGKRKREQKLKEIGGGDLHDCCTVFVNKLPYHFTTAQLEESFSEIGPIRRCFLVQPKGSEQHRGFGFVQFAVVEDAKRAVEAKNGFVMGGRKISVVVAKHRPSLQQRRAKMSKVDMEGPTDNVEDHKTVDKTNNKIRIDLEGEETKEGSLISEKKAKPKACNQEKAKVPPSIQSLEESRNFEETKTPGKKRRCITSNSEFKSSSIQRVARTVIFGGLMDHKMTEAVLSEAKKAGPVESITNPLPEFELQTHGLATDGCKMGAVAVLFVSVKSACQAVARLHHQVIQGGVVWARQLGGEGSKTRKCRLIVRNLPFEANEVELRKLFSTAGFVWNITLPQGSGGRPSKGFAFVTFTCKRDAEKAIHTINGTKVSKRPIAVDWAVSKKKYETVLNSGAVKAGDEVSGGEESELKDNDTASEDEANDDLEEHPTSSIHVHDNCVDDHRPNNNCTSDKDDGIAGAEHLNILNEMDMAKKVLNNVINSRAKEDETFISSVQNLEELTGARTVVLENQKVVTRKPTNVVFKEENANCEAEMAIQKAICAQKDESLQKTIFISNLPFDVDNEEMKTRFSAFGKIKSVHCVLHRLTKRPKGTAFIEYETIQGAEAAILAAKIRQGLVDSGITVKGRPLTVLKAIDKKSADHKAIEKVENEDHDHRNLYLTKEGLILEGTTAAAGVSKEDLSKRQLLARQKEIKLRSPNFHVSKTRLAIYNVPKSMTEIELKKLFIVAVQSRASKQNPVIKQVKILRDIKKPVSGVKGRPRGVAFIEFGEHEHAIVALRVLNNNPETFGPERRPIVEFAIEDVRKLQKRKLFAASAQTRNGRREVSADNKRQIKNEMNVSVGDNQSEPFKPLKGGVKENTVTRNRKERKKNQNKTNVNLSVEDKSQSSKPLNEDERENAVKASKKDTKNRRKVRRGKLKMENNSESNASGRFNKQKQKTVSGKGAAETREKEQMTDKSTGGHQAQDAKTVQLSMVGPGNKNVKLQQKVHEQKLMKRKLHDCIDAVSDKQKRRRPKKKANSGKEIEDEVDKLVARYRSKLFSNRSNSNKKNEFKQGTGELGRWFE